MLERPRVVHFMFARRPERLAPSREALPCASLAGFTLHAATRAGALDPVGRESCCATCCDRPSRTSAGYCAGSQNCESAADGTTQANAADSGAVQPEAESVQRDSQTAAEGCRPLAWPVKSSER
jgi:hypothetical protein